VFYYIVNPSEERAQVIIEAIPKEKGTKFQLFAEMKKMDLKQAK